MSKVIKENLDIFLSIHPQYASKILEGLKTIELRKRFPDLNGYKGRILIYSTAPIQRVVGYVEIVQVHRLPVEELWTRFNHCSCIEKIDFDKYFYNALDGFGCGIEIMNPVQFSSPVSIDDLRKTYGIVAPQSYRYLNEQHADLFNRC